jgi:ASC-1-like (ASCH) protein
MSVHRISLDPDKAFELFYKEHYSSLPRWVDQQTFKTDLKENYLIELSDARSKGESYFSCASVMYPLISETIDMHSHSNCMFFFENDEQMLPSYTITPAVELHVAEPWMSLIRKGKKTAEVRVGTEEKWDKYLGKVIMINDLLFTVIDFDYFDTLEECLKYYYREAAPHATTVTDAIHMYQNFVHQDVHIFSTENVKSSGGVVAMEIEPYLFDVQASS